MLRPNEHTLAHRKTASNVYCVLEGEGYTEVEGTRLEWRRNDVFTVPGWLWHEHKNTGGGNAFLYSVTDEPTMRKLGLFREEGRTAAGAIELLAA
jgi:gentisate 1,2-dioxygenase